METQNNNQNGKTAKPVFKTQSGQTAVVAQKREKLSSTEQLDIFDKDRRDERLINRLNKRISRLTGMPSETRTANINARIAKYQARIEKLQEALKTPNASKSNSDRVAELKARMESVQKRKAKRLEDVTSAFPNFSLDKIRQIAEQLNTLESDDSE